MVQWYVKELSELTQVSVQTLHHYDRIGLLQPSIRLANNYRLYSEKDLLKLQQIIALKFFGFTLAQIKKLLAQEVDLIDHFSIQSKLLENKAKSLLEASQALKTILAEYSHDKSLPWETIIQLIEVYRMTQQLENTWAGKVLTPEELKEYVAFEQGVKNRPDKKAFEAGWDKLVQIVHANLNQDPTSEFGIEMGERCMEWVNSFYGKQYASLRTAIWEKGIKGGHLSAETGLSPAGVVWLDQAMDAYVQHRLFTILNQIETHPHHAVLKRWDDMMDEFFGANQAAKKEFLALIIKDKNIPQAAKNWVKQHNKLD